jgi:hypothetical protein
VALRRTLASNGPGPRSRKRRRADARPSCSGSPCSSLICFSSRYESWNILVPVLLSVSVGVLGAIVAVMLAGLSFDVVVLIALATKNGVLIVAFAVEQRRLGRDTGASAIEAAGLRFRAATGNACFPHCSRISERDLFLTSGV